MFFQQLKSRKDWQGYLLSLVFSLFLIVHLMNSDVVVAGKSPSSEPAPQASKTHHKPIRVKVVEIAPQFIEKELQIYGRTQAHKTLLLRSERDATVQQLFLQQGHAVNAGTRLMRLDAGNLKNRILHAQALLKQRQLEYDSAISLQEEGFQARLIVAQKSTLLAEAQAALADLNNQQRDTLIKSPLQGILNQVFVEQGDYLKVGDKVAQVLVLNPIIVVIHVPETAVVDLAKGQKADVSLLNGKHYEAEVTYIAASSDSGTNTFKVELELDNSDYKIPAGISSTVTLKTQRLAATPISPAYLSLNELGQSGLYVVEDGLARFKPANIVKSNAKQLWVDSLGDNAQVIIAGHQGILEGSRIELMQDTSSDTLTF
ncbi:MAG: efflux RND transporter periplasmic adaptor subunit [Pseudomonadales bacterium]|nr:efflux RND transporter periplasmic adaptor subunit [Pseudomonadales bacterium]